MYWNEILHGVVFGAQKLPHAKLYFHPMNVQFVTLKFQSFWLLYVHRLYRWSGGPILLTIYTSNGVFPCKDVRFGCPVDTVPHLGGQIFQNSQKGGPNSQSIKTCISPKVLDCNQILEW